MSGPATQAGRIGELVGVLRGLVAEAESDWRRRLPPLSRDAPRPDPQATQGARTLEAVGRELDAIGGQLRTLPLMQRLHPAARLGEDAAGRLVEIEAAILAHGGFLLELLGPRPAGAAVDPEALRTSIDFLRELMQRRTELLC